MSSESILVPRDEATLRSLLVHAVERYEAGGTPVGGHGSDPWLSTECHWTVLDELEHLPEFEHGEAYARFLRKNHLDCPAGLSALVRLVASASQAALLTWLLDEPVEIDGRLTAPSTFAEVKNEAAGLPGWSH